MWASFICCRPLAKRMATPRPGLVWLSGPSGCRQEAPSQASPALQGGRGGMGVACGRNGGHTVPPLNGAHIAAAVGHTAGTPRRRTEGWRGCHHGDTPSTLGNGGEWWERETGKGKAGLRPPAPRTAPRTLQRGPSGPGPGTAAARRRTTSRTAPHRSAPPRRTTGTPTARSTVQEGRPQDLHSSGNMEWARFRFQDGSQSQPAGSSRDCHPAKQTSPNTTTWRSRRAHG